MSNNTTPKREPIAIIGMDCLFPNSGGLHEYWRTIRHGEDGVSEIPESHWSISDYCSDDPTQADMIGCRRGAFLSETVFDPVEFGIPPTVIEATDTAQLLSLVVAKRALKDAGYDNGHEFDRDRTSVVLGVTGMQELVLPLGARLSHPLWRKSLRDAGVPSDVAEDVVKRISDGYVQWQENSFPGLLGNVVAGRIANRLNLHGANCVVDAACASSLAAVHMAAMELQSGRANMVLTGGVDTLNDIFMFMCFHKAQALSPTGDARPFAKDADGTVIGEGVGILVMKRLSDAERDGDRIYATLKGVGTASDGRSQSIYAPHVEGQARALRNAYDVSDVDPVTIELVEAHGTGTKVGDVVEFEALTKVYREASPIGQWCALGSVKSQIGHTKAAAGAASLVKTVLALHNRVLPATTKVAEPNPKLQVEQSPFYISTETRPWFSSGDHPRRAAVSSFGFGGSNFHAVLEEYARAEHEPAWDGSVELIALSAKAPAGLDQKLERWIDAAAKGLTSQKLAARAAKSRDEFSAKAPYRLAVVAEHDADLCKLLASARDALRTNGASEPWQTPNVYFGGPDQPGKLAFLFPGQGSQYVGMGRDAVCHFPEAFEAVAEANALIGGEQSNVEKLPKAPQASACAAPRGLKPAARGGLQHPLSDLIYPQPTFDRDERRANEDELTKTENAQPALGAVSLAMLRVLKRFGVKPDFTAGHSFGELVALRAAGRIGDEALRRLAQLRGRLMAEAKGVADGAMLAIHAPLDEIEKLLKKHGGDVVLANRNAPSQGIISGVRKAVEKVAGACEQKGWRTKMLRVSSAFHSKFMAPAQERFRAALEEITFELGRIPVFANVTAALYPDDANGARDLLARQLTNPVNFVDQIKHLYDAGARTFIEVGPKNVLTGLVRNILHSRPFHALALDAGLGRGSGVTDIARGLALLAVLGYSVDVQAWERPEPEVSDPSMAIPLLGVNYRNPAKPTPETYRSPERSVQPEVGIDGMTKPDNGDTRIDTPAPAWNIASSDGFATPAAAPLNTVGGEHLAQAFQVVQEGLRSMQALQQQTAAAHQQFLQTQEQAHRTFQMVMQGQQQLMAGALGMRTEPFAPIAPQPVYAPPPTWPIAPPSMTPMVAQTEIRSSTAESGGNGEARAIETALVSVVSEKTGYSYDNIHLDMRLEDDLGIDTIRRSEILAELQARCPSWTPPPATSSNGPRTLRDIVHYSPSTAAPAAAPASSGGIGEVAAQTEVKTAGSEGEFATIVLEAVSELTGYPVEMLDLDMDMESDLGIDSIKRLEILGAVQRRVPEMAEVNSQYAGSLRTLRNIIDYASGDTGEAGTPEKKTAQPALPAEQVADSAPSPAARLERRVLQAVELAPAKQRPLRIASGREIWVTDDGATLAPTIVKRLKALGHTARVIGPRAGWRNTGERKIAGLIILGSIDGTGGASFDEKREDALKLAFKRVKSLGADLRDAAEAGGALLATVSRLDGAFGLKAGGFDALQGGLSGLTKTAAHEWPKVRCRALDVANDLDDVDAAAEAIVNELGAEGPIEVGLGADRRAGLELIDAPAVAGDLPLSDGDVVVITGGARGVTAEAALALAREKCLALVLFGRSAAPGPEPEWLAGLESEAEIKRALLANAFADGKPKPADLQAEFQRRMANREIARNLERLRATGATIDYRAVDVRDRAAVAALFDSVRREHGPIRGLIHAAGVLADALIDDKTPEQFDRVFDTKVRGLRALLEATRDDDLRFIALFSSVSGRFGREGQVDYAMANEVLNKVAHQQAALRPNCRVVSINWGPWNGGMVTPGLKHEFERLGIDLIPLEAGALAMIDELRTPNREEIEVTIGGAFPESVSAHPPVVEAQLAQSVGRGGPTPQSAVAFERTLDTESHPFLLSHVIGGNPVLPMAVILEWLGHGALHDNPGLLLHGVDGFRVLKGVVLDNGPATIRVSASRAKRVGDLFEIDTELRGEGAGAREFIHARAKVLLATRLPDPPAYQIPGELRGQPYAAGVEAVYRDIIFHGPSFQALRSIESLSSHGMVVTAAAAPPPGDWMSDPPRSGWLTDPLAIDAGMQLGLIWCHEELGAVSLPAYLASYRQYRAFPAGDVTIAMAVREAEANRMVADLTFLDADGRVIARSDGQEWTVDQSLRAAFDQKTVASV